jgi:hypothetical protein
MGEDLKSQKPRFHVAFLKALKDAILRRKKIRFGDGFVVTETEDEILVSVKK